MVQHLESEIEENPYVSKFLQFFEMNCKKDIEHLVSEYPEKRSLCIDFKALEEFDYKLADELLDNPEYLLASAKQAIEKVDVPSLEIEKFSPHIRFFNLPADRTLLLRDIGSQHLNKLIAVEGVIKQITDVLPRLKIAVWKCRRCGNVYRVEQTSSQEIKQPAFCECRHRDFSLIEEESEFVDYQKITIQEPLEALRGNEQPTDLNVYLADDLVNKVTAGDKIIISGILRLSPGKKITPVFGRFLEALHIEETSKEFEEIEILPEEIEEIKALAADPKIFEKLVASVAPAIYGHEIVKEAVVLQLFGGVKKALPGGQSIRGNIHILLVGDPGTAKSQTLMAASKIAPKSIYVAGKTTTSVGLCVAPDSLVLNDSGFRNIKDFVEDSFNEKNAVEEIDNAWSNEFSGKAPCLSKDLKIKDSQIYKIWRIKAPEKMFKIRTQSGKEIELTPNTSLLRIKEGSIDWIKAVDLNKNDFIACPRRLPEGKKEKLVTIELLCKDKNIRIKNNVSELFKEITDKLIKKYGGLQNIAKKMNKSRDTIYAIRNKKFYHGICLSDFVELGKEAGYSVDELSKHVDEIFISHGKELKIPRYLDDPEIAYLAGIALGDGNVYLTDKSASVRIFNTSQCLLQEIERIVEEKFGLKAESFDDGKRVPGRRIKFRAVYEILKAFGLDKDKSKIRISHLASEMNNSILSKLLMGLFDADGYVSQSSVCSSHIGLSTISEQLAKTLQLCLLKFGINSKLRKRKKAGKLAVGKKIKIKSKHDQYYVEIRGKENLIKFKNSIGFNLLNKKNALETIIQSINKGKTNVDFVPEINVLFKENKGIDWVYRVKRSKISRKKLNELIKSGNIEDKVIKDLAESDVFWEKIVSKEEFTPRYEFVYDFSVEKDHNFIANGFFVHNTASAVKDEFGEGGWTLKAGALVLASGGVVMADELDKMPSEDRSALHEAMEQGRISIAKAGIVTQFKTDTSILAAANPKFSRFDPYMSFIEQVNLPSTLISRFDLFFMIKDVLDRTKDAEITSHILKTHQSGQRISQQKVHGKPLSKKEMEDIEKIVTPAIDPEFLRKYISYARQNVFPALSKEAIQTISEFYLDLRERGKQDGSYTATHRQLEGLVRLSEAAARVRLKDTIEKEDAERAIRLLKFSLEDVVRDPATGKIDIDLVTTGQAHSQTEEMKKVLRIIKDKSAEFDEITLESVLEEASNAGIEREKAEEYIRKLEQKGEIYRPKYNLVKPTQFK